MSAESVMICVHAFCNKNRALNSSYCTSCSVEVCPAVCSGCDVNLIPDKYNCGNIGCDKKRPRGERYCIDCLIYQKNR